MTKRTLALAYILIAGGGFVAWVLWEVLNIIMEIAG